MTCKLIYTKGIEQGHYNPMSKELTHNQSFLSGNPNMTREEKESRLPYLLALFGGGIVLGRMYNIFD